MGFKQDEIKHALQISDNNTEIAVQLLLTATDTMDNSKAQIVTLLFNIYYLLISYIYIYVYKKDDTIW